MDEAERIQVWRGMLAGIGGAWVLFANGTCVTLADPGADPAAQAKSMLREFGPAGVREAVADFAGTVEIPDSSGWVVASRHADINTFVGRGEVAPGTSDETVGRLGRSKRALDTEQLRVLHVEARTTRHSATEVDIWTRYQDGATIGQPGEGAWPPPGW